MDLKQKDQNRYEEIEDPIRIEIPEALPLYNLKPQTNYEEPEIKLKKRQNQIVDDQDLNKSQNQHIKQQCKHIKVKDYKCQECQAHIPQFNSIFDTGNVYTYLNIKYVNEYMDQATSNHLGASNQQLITIYECYKPKNTQEMREYILFTIDKSVRKVKKSRKYSDQIINQLLLIGQSKNQSSELKNYIYLKRNREFHILGYEQTPNQEKEGSIQYNCIGPQCLLFDSFFEGANLERAEYVSLTEYNLYLNVDTNTKGHQQWFYFKVKNTQKDKKYTFHIRNFTKPFSLHRQGMQIMMKSKKKQEEEEDMTETWIPIGQNVCYWRTDIQRSGWRIPGPLNLDDEEDDDQILDDINGIDGITHTADNGQKIKPKVPLLSNLGGNLKKRKRYFYCLTFEVEFDYDDDIVYFAYSTPYTYSSIFLQMYQIEQQLIEQSQNQNDYKLYQDPKNFERQISTNELYYERKLLCKSISGLPVPIITITARRHKGLEYRKRQAICITARVHPGETNSNFVFDGFIESILDCYSSSLLQNYIFKLIPCLNPDGAICGNYRSSLAGVDLNRQWIVPNKELHPTIFYAKEMLAQLSKERELLVFCDLHCHSKKKNSFIYGCNTAANGGFTSWTKVRLLPRILAKLCPLFNIKDCRFRIDSSKLGTARVIVWKEFGVTNSFTLENSFFGYEYGKDIIKFSPQLYKEIGENFINALQEFRILLKQIEREIHLTNGWLKPKLLLEITGIPAAEKIAKEMAQKHKEAKRMKKIQEYRQNMGLTGADVDLEQNSIIMLKDIKTRNIFRANTETQKEKLNKLVDYKKQISNKSEKLFQKENLKKESSSESTKLESMRKFTMTSFDEPKLECIIKTQKQSQLDYLLNPQIQEKVKMLQRYVRKFLQKIRQNNKSQIQHPKRKQSQNLTKTMEFDDDQMIAQRKRTKSCHDWRMYFDNIELENIYQKIEIGQDPNDDEKLSASDDLASEDNFDLIDLYKDVYMRETQMDKEITKIKKVENKFLEQIKELNEEKLNSNSQFPFITQGHLPQIAQMTPVRQRPELETINPVEKPQIAVPSQPTNPCNVSSSFQLQKEEKFVVLHQPNNNNKIKKNSSKDKMIKLMNVIANVNEGRRKTFDPVLYQRSFYNSKQDQFEQRSFIQPCQHSQNNEYSQQDNSFQIQPNKRPSTQFLVQKQDRNQSCDCIMNDEVIKLDVQSQGVDKSIEKTPQYFNKIKAVYSGIKSHQENRLSRQNISFNQKSTDNASKNNFQQYIMKNLRYEDARIQQAYSKIENNKSLSIGQQHILPREDVIIRKKILRQKEDPYNTAQTQIQQNKQQLFFVQPQQIPIHQMPSSRQAVKLLLPALKNQSLISQSKTKKRPQKGIKNLVLQGVNAFQQLSQPQQQTNKVNESNRSFNAYQS